MVLLSYPLPIVSPIQCQGGTTIVGPGASTTAPSKEFSSNRASFCGPTVASSLPLCPSRGTARQTEINNPALCLHFFFKLYIIIVYYEDAQMLLVRRNEKISREAVSFFNLELLKFLILLFKKSYLFIYLLA